MQVNKSFVARLSHKKHLVDDIIELHCKITDKDTFFKLLNLPISTAGAFIHCLFPTEQSGEPLLNQNAVFLVGFKTRARTATISCNDHDKHRMCLIHARCDLALTMRWMHRSMTVICWHVEYLFPTLYIFGHFISPIKTFTYYVPEHTTSSSSSSSSSKRPRLDQIPAANLDADDPLTDVSVCTVQHLMDTWRRLALVKLPHRWCSLCLQDDEDEDSEEDSDDDDTAALLAELEKIKKERAEEQERKVKRRFRPAVWKETKAWRS